MGWIMWNGVSSEEMGLVVERMPYISRAKLRTQEFVVPGRSGVLHAWDGSHEMITLKILLNLMQSQHAGEINAWLSGRGTLITSDEPTRCWKGIIAQEVAWTRYRPYGHAYDSISVMIDADPYMYEASPSHTVLVEADSIEGDGTLPAAPLIAVSGEGEGALSVGGTTVSFTGLTAGTPLYLDCDAKIAYTLSDGEPESANALVEIVDNEWPALACTGSTAVSWTGGVTGIDVQHNWRWL